MSISLTVLHGLPGVGKTTVCRAIAASRPNLYFADLLQHPDFGKLPMAEICAELYLREGLGRGLLTEGVLAKKAARDKFVTNVAERIELRVGLPVFPINVIFVDETNYDFMSSRRRRSADEYRDLRATIETGSLFYEYHVYRCEEIERNSVELRTARFLSFMDEIVSQTRG